MRHGLLVLGALIAAAQQADEVRVSARAYTPPALHLTAQAQLVQLSVVVRDGRGHAVAGLGQSDFEILDEGKARPIAAFSVETRARAEAAPSSPGATAATRQAAAPSAAQQRSVMLFFDDVHANTGELRRAQNAAQSFVRKSFTPGMRAAVLAATEGLTQDFTSDTEKLAAAIEKLRPHPRVPENGLSSCPRISPYQAYLIFHNIDPSAMISAVSEAHSCDAADTSISNVYNNTATRPGAMSKLPRDELSIVVQQQATQTWELARASSLETYDALQAAVARLAPLPGTRVLLLVTEGFLYGPAEAARQQDLIDAAIRAGVVINGLDAKGLWAEPPSRPLNETLDAVALPVQTFIYEAAAIGARISALNATVSELATATGGLFFHNSNDLTGGFEQLGAVPETTYLMAFRPDAQDAAGRYRKLKVRLTSARQEYIETRPGYFAPAAAAESAGAPRRLDREVAANDEVSEIPVQLSGRMGKTDQGAPLLSLIVHVDLAKLRFEDRDGRHRQRLEFIGALVNAQGEMVAAKEGSMELALRDDGLARLTASGVNATLGLSAPPGRYRVRVVVEEAGGKVAALSQAVELAKE